jgi:hypothetical protein
MTRTARVRAIVAAILIAGWALTLAISWPGHLSFDSIVQLHDGRTGFYHSWHPPVMAWLLGAGDALMPGAGLYVLFVTTLTFGSFFALMWTRPSASWAAAVLAILFVPLPQFLLYPMLVWKDVLFAAAAVAGFVCLSLAEAHWKQRPIRGSLLAVPFLLAVLATLTRQNGLIALVAIATAFAWIVARNSNWVRGAVCGAVALAAAGVTTFAISSALAAHSDGGEGTRTQLRLLRFYDLVGAVATDPHLPLDTIAGEEPDLEALMRSDGRRLYSPERNDTLVGSQALQNALGQAEPSMIAAQWYDLVRRHPWLYLKVRARVFAQVLFTPDIEGCRPVFTGIEGPSGEMADLGLTPRRDARDLALANYAKRFMGTPVFSHAVFGVLSIAVLVLLLWRRAPGDIAIAALLASALVFTASFFVISIACDYRYLYFLDMAALCAVFTLALDPSYLFMVVAMWSGSFWDSRSDERKS